jgi:ATP-dependent Clp protease ATP-binding subunit ClpC
VLERFPECGRQVIALAQDEAQQLGHDYIGTEHLLFAVFREEEGLAARTLESLDVRLDDVRAKVLRTACEGAEGPTSQIPSSKHARRVLELALCEALSLGHDYIGAEHILLGLVRETEGIAARILLDFDADAKKVRNAVIRMLGEPGR